MRSRIHPAVVDRLAAAVTAPVPLHDACTIPPTSYKDYVVRTSGNRLCTARRRGRCKQWEQTAGVVVLSHGPRHALKTPTVDTLNPTRAMAFTGCSTVFIQPH